MRLIFPTDVFPPDGKGGAAWSSHALARALIARGHSLTAVVPRRGGGGLAHYDALGVPALRVGYRAPGLPFVQNYARHERLWRRLAAAIVAEARRGPPPAAIHAQHVQTAPAAVLAGRELGAPVVVTVRDHWPWDYFATGLHADRLPYQGQSWASLAADLPQRLGPLAGAAALAALPYMLGHLRRRQAFLARADAVIACSGYIARRLEGIVPPGRVHVLPHMADTAALAATVAASPQTELRGPFLLFAGKLEPNKGVHLLGPIMAELRELGVDPGGFELLIAGDGALRPQLERRLAELGVRARFLAWAGHDEVLRLMARCDLLLFPSAWGEPLSRVLIEAMAVGAPILAMPTGGTPDLIVDGRTGALAATPRAFAARLAALLADPAGRAALGAAARDFALRQLDVSSLAPRYEALYAGLGGPA